MPEKIKILFADLYRLNACAKDEVKSSAKTVSELLDSAEWEELAMRVESIINDTERLQRICEGILSETSAFINSNSPYAAQSAMRTPLENIAEGRR